MTVFVYARVADVDHLEHVATSVWRAGFHGPYRVAWAAT